MRLPITYKSKQYFLVPLCLSFALSSIIVGVVEVFADIFFNYNIFETQALLIQIAFNIPAFLIIYPYLNRVRSITLANDHIAIKYPRLNKNAVKIMVDEILYVEICVPVNKVQQPHTFNIFPTPEIFHRFTDFDIPLPDFIAYLKERNVRLIYDPDQISPTAKSF